MTENERRQVIDLAREVDIDASVFDGWNGKAIGIYRVTGGRSRDCQVAERIAQENEERESWTLDLGNRQTGTPQALSLHQIKALKDKLKAAGIAVCDSRKAMDPFRK
jgi:hypothetical protein